MTSMGTILNVHTVRFERVLPCSIEDAWEYISTKEGIAKWHRCIADFSIELRKGGQVSYRICPPPPPAGPPAAPTESASGLANAVSSPSKGFIQRARGLVLECVEPRVLAHSFIDTSCDVGSELRFELQERDGQVVLILAHSHLPAEMMAQVAAGWHAHLDALVAVLNNKEPSDFMTVFMEQFQKYSVAVAATLVVASSASPALANANDSGYKSMIDQRARLLNSYDRVWKETDDLKYQLAVLGREKTENTNRASNDLERDLREKYDKLHQIEIDIRDLDKSLI